MIDLREPRKGDLLTADFLAAMLRELVRVGKIAGGPDVRVGEDGAGIRISVEFPRRVYYAVVTTAAPAFSGTTYGKGVATVDVESYTSANVCTRAATASPAWSVDFQNGGLEAIPVGHRVQLEEIAPGRFHALTHFCQ